MRHVNVLVGMKVSCEGSSDSKSFNCDFLDLEESLDDIGKDMLSESSKLRSCCSILEAGSLHKRSQDVDDLVFVRKERDSS
jgi:hypothetical protein